MGMDQSVYYVAAKGVLERRHEIIQWRKFYDLNDFMMELFHQKNRFNIPYQIRRFYLWARGWSDYPTVELTRADIERLDRIFSCYSRTGYLVDMFEKPGISFTKFVTIAHRHLGDGKRLFYTADW